MTWIAVAATAILLVAGVASSPIEVTAPSKELLPPEVPTPATDLLPPSASAENNWSDKELVAPALPEDESAVKKAPATLFLINIYAVKNRTAENSNDVLHDDVMEEVSDESSEPVAMFILVVEEEDENHPVSLDDVARDFEQEGFNIEKVAKDGETRLVKVDLGSVEKLVKVDDQPKDNAIDRILAAAEDKKAQDAKEELMKVRRKRHLHHHHSHNFGGGGGGCSICSGGGGGGGYYPPPQPVYIQPVPIRQPQYGGGGGGCNTCGGGGGGGGGGGYAQASAQASASASAQAGGYGK